MIGRQRLRMNKGWKFQRGQMSVLPEGRMHNDICLAVKAGGLGGPAGNGYPTEEWETVEIPHDWSVAADFEKRNLMVMGISPEGKAGTDFRSG